MSLCLCSEAQSGFEIGKNHDRNITASNKTKAFERMVLFLSSQLGVVVGDLQIRAGIFSHYFILFYKQFPCTYGGG